MISSNIVGVDIGGTFTDLVGWVDGRIVTAKTSTTPADQTQGVAMSLELAGAEPAALGEVLHGATTAINTVLERAGARTVLVTTRGFRDVYAIGRGNRIEAFNLDFHRPKPLVERRHTLEVAERVGADGTIITPLADADVAALVDQVRALGCEAVAVCLLHSWANPGHERRLAAALRGALPSLFVTASHEILREFREYERTSTTVLNAYVGPRVSRYLGTLEQYLRRERFGGQLHIMRSNGGVMSVSHARGEPVSMMESGPVAGMIAAGRLAQHLGLERVIGFDMGGTTAKSSLITGGEAPIEEGYVIGTPASGQPMQLPVVDIVEVGAGGGSIAWVDEAGGLHVGPRSAGADPGPACYGRGTAAQPGEPVVTDADLVLGRINAGRFLGGQMTLDVKAAARAIEQRIARPLGLSVMDAALGIAQIADAAMSLSVRAVSVNKGVDPRETTMIAFGGAGPLHALAIAREIFIPRVVIPKLPGNFSALGMLMASWRQDFVRTLIGRIGALEAARVASAFDELAREGEALIARDGIARARAELRFLADLRYVGQEHALQIPVPGPDALTGDTSEVRHRFHLEHDKRYGQAAVEEALEIVNVRLIVTAPRGDRLAEAWLGEPWPPSGAAEERRRDVIFADAERPLSTRILWRPALPAGFALDGPAVIEEPNSTILIHPGDRAVVGPTGHLTIDVAL